MPATVYEFKSHLAYQWLVNRMRKHFKLRVFPLFFSLLLLVSAKATFYSPNKIDGTDEIVWSPGIIEREILCFATVRQSSTL